jgi:hypothetical protein
MSQFTRDKIHMDSHHCVNAGEDGHFWERRSKRVRRISGRLLRRISKAKAVLDFEPFLSWNFEANADTYLCVDCRMQLNKLATAGLLYFVSIRDYIVRQYLRKDGNKT